MTTSGATVETKLAVGDQLPPGTKVTVHPRAVDHTVGTPGTPQVASGKVDDNGDVTLKGLVPHGPYVLSGVVSEVEPGRRTSDGDELYVDRVRNVNFNAAGDEQVSPDLANSRAEAELQARREREARHEVVKDLNDGAFAPAERKPQVVTGARSSLDRPRAKTHAGPDHDARLDPKVLEPQPHPKQEDVSDKTPQRSATPAGQATPKEIGELQPRPSQQDVKPGTPQRSDTPLGEATPRDPGEQQPQARQEESKGRQRSDTPQGAQTPKPTTKSAVEQEKVRESSVSKAKGSGTTAVAGTDKTVNKKHGTKAQRAKAADPVKASSKRAAKKSDS